MKVGGEDGWRGKEEGEKMGGSVKIKVSGGDRGGGELR